MLVGPVSCTDLGSARFIQGAANGYCRDLGVDGMDVRLESRGVAMVVDRLMRLAIDQARIGLSEGGIPIGSVLAVGDEVLGAGHNRRVQQGSPILHAEIDCLDRAGRLPATTYHRSTLYTTLSPCFLCAGAVLLYGIPRVVVGENRTFGTSEKLLRSHGVQVDVLDLDECAELMTTFITEHPHLWNEDIGVED